MKGSLLHIYIRTLHSINKMFASACYFYSLCDKRPTQKLWYTFLYGHFYKHNEWQFVVNITTESFFEIESERWFESWCVSLRSIRLQLSRYDDNVTVSISCRPGHSRGWHRCLTRACHFHSLASDHSADITASKRYTKSCRVDQHKKRKRTPLEYKFTDKLVRNFWTLMVASNL